MKQNNCVSLSLRKFTKFYFFEKFSTTTAVLQTTVGRAFLASTILVVESEDLHFSPAPFSAQKFGKFSSDHHETPLSSIVASKDDLESRDDVLEKSLSGNVAKLRFT